jgi:hypothetical protein
LYLKKLRHEQRKLKTSLLKSSFAVKNSRSVFLFGSICLPMDNTSIGDQVYLVSLLLVNGLAFVLICACYLKIYCTISGHNTIASRTDTTVAKRMALLVFTDFACWAPIAFFGLTAVAGHPLIDVTQSKVGFQKLRKLTLAFKG